MEFGKYKFEVTEEFPDNTPNRDMALAVFQAYQSYGFMAQLGWGYVISGLKNSVKIDDTDARKAIQQNVNEMIEGLGMLYCFSIWDHHMDPLPKGTQDTIVNEWMTDEERQRFLAYKHVRHSVGHCWSGRRAEGLRKEFEAEMNGKHPLHGLSWDETNDTIDMSGGGLALSCYQFLKDLSQTVAGHLMNNNKP